MKTTRETVIIKLIYAISMSTRGRGQPGARAATPTVLVVVGTINNCHNTADFRTNKLCIIQLADGQVQVFLVLEFYNPNNFIAILIDVCP